MTAWIAQWTLDASDVERMAALWSAALGYRTEIGGDGSAKLYPPDDAGRAVRDRVAAGDGRPEGAKNRLHPDLRPRDGDVDAEVQRLLELGATPADVGQTGDEPVCRAGRSGGKRVLRAAQRTSAGLTAGVLCAYDVPAA